MASMNANDSGVAKWSVLREHDQSRIGQGGHQAIGRPREVPVAERHQHRGGQRGQVGLGELPCWALEHRRQRLGVVAGLLGVVPEGLGLDVVLRSFAPHTGDDAAGQRGVAIEHRVADAGEDDAPEASGLRAGQLQQREGSQREPDGVHGAVGRQGVCEPGGQVTVGLGIVGLVGLAVAQEVDADHGAPGILQQCADARRHPGPLERRAPAVDEEDGCRHVRRRYFPRTNRVR